VLRRLIAAALVGLVLLVAASARLFVWPPSDRAIRADAVVALAGAPDQHRAAVALALAHAGYAPLVVLSTGGTHLRCPPQLDGIPVRCFRPDPVDTRGEAEAIAQLAAELHWRRIIVVPVRTQTTRARLLIGRCTPIPLVMVPAGAPAGAVPGQVVYEWGALAKALVLKPHC